MKIHHTAICTRQIGASLRFWRGGPFCAGGAHAGGTSRMRPPRRIGLTDQTDGCVFVLPGPRDPSPSLGPVIVVDDPFGWGQRFD